MWEVFSIEFNTMQILERKKSVIDKKVELNFKKLSLQIHVMGKFSMKEFNVIKSLEYII